MLTNLAYLYVLPIGAIRQSPLVAADTMLALFGRAGVVLVSVFVMISSFSSLNGSMLASPRVFFAMAEDRLLFQPIAAVHPRYRTPYVAILVAAALGVALVMSRSFERLTDTFVLAIWPFYALGVAAIYRLRRERPDLPRPYRALGYPVVPAVFIASVIAFVVNALSPAEVVSIRWDEASNTAFVAVPDKQLSLAIGKEGQNARLAARLTGWRIDIRSDSPAPETQSQPRPATTGSAE